MWLRPPSLCWKKPGEIAAVPDLPVRACSHRNKAPKITCSNNVAIDGMTRVTPWLSPPHAWFFPPAAPKPSINPGTCVCPQLSAYCIYRKQPAARGNAAQNKTQPECSAFAAFLRKLSKRLQLLTWLSLGSGDRDPLAKAGMGKEMLLQPLCRSVGSLRYPGLSLCHSAPCSQPASWARKQILGSRNGVIAVLQPAQPQPIASDRLLGGFSALLSGAAPSPPARLFPGHHKTLVWGFRALVIQCSAAIELEMQTSRRPRTVPGG